jgi:hypothetical protein
MACIVFFSGLSPMWQTIIANLIGGIIFFYIDSQIFNVTKRFKDEVWETIEKVRCCDCNKEEKGYRLIYKKDSKYNRIDHTPEFRCSECSAKKYKGEK